MKLVIEIDEARFKDIQRIAGVQLKSNYFQTAEQIIASGSIVLDKIKVEVEEEDCISRRAVLDMMQIKMSDKELYMAVYELPSVNPQPQESNQQLCDDVISRQAAKKALEDRFMELQKRHDDKRYETNYCLNTILELPPVKPQPKTGHWIPVSERLPKKYGVYIVTLNDHDTDFCEFYPDKQSFGMNGNLCDEVTAWMPLPEPYKVESEEI